MAVNPTAIWRVRPGGSNTNGGGYDPGISGAATDYSQQNAAQATGTLGTASGTTTFTDAGGAFTAAMVGNALWIASGAGFTVSSAYFITAFGSSTSVTLDRSPGTGTAAVWALGGGWADPWTNCGLNTGTGVVDGNTVFILGSGVPNPSSYTYDYVSTTYHSMATSPAFPLNIFANDPATPGYKALPDTTGGMPVIKCTGLTFYQCYYQTFQGLWLVNVSTSNANQGLINGATYIAVIGCVFDQTSFDCTGFYSNDHSVAIACEFFSSTGLTGGANQAIQYNGTSSVFNCNIHDWAAGGIMDIGFTITIQNNIIAKCNGTGIELSFGSGNIGGCSTISGNTIDGNSGHGILVDYSKNLFSTWIFNNIISNHTGGGDYGFSVAAGTADSNQGYIQFLIDYNVFYNNTSSYNAINAGPHDTALGVTPYVGSTTENYTLV